MVLRGPGSDPLFRFSDSRSLTTARFVSELRNTLSQTGVDPAAYAGRIGAAMTAARQGLQDSLIQTLGRWQSSAYNYDVH